MHNIKLLRENPDYYQKKFQDRNINLNINDLLNLDKKNREIISRKEKLEQQKKTISKTKNETQFKKSKEISNQIKNLEKELFELKDNINKILHFLPNIALDDVPIGLDEKSNKELIKFCKTLEEVCIETVEDGKMTKDLALLVFRDDLVDSNFLTTQQFLDELKKNLDLKLNSKE